MFRITANSRRQSRLAWTCQGGNDPNFSEYQCLRQCSPPTGNNLKPIASTAYYEGETARLECAAGYSFNGTQFPERKCENLKFPVTNCELITCTPPPLENGYFCDDKNPDKKSFVPGDSVTYRCNRCFALRYLKPTEDTRKYTWSGHKQHKSINCTGSSFPPHNLVCEPLMCGNPPVVINGQPKNTTALCGQSIEYECDRGFTPPAPITAKCGADSNDDISDGDYHGFFSLPSGACRPASCTKESLPKMDNSWQPVMLPAGFESNSFYGSEYRNGFPNFNYQSEAVYKTGDVAIFECYEDFIPAHEDDFFSNLPPGYELDIAASKITIGLAHPLDLDTDALIAKKWSNENKNLLFREGKLRSICQIDGTWSKPTHKCKCISEYKKCLAQKKQLWFDEREMVCANGEAISRTEYNSKIISGRADSSLETEMLRQLNETKMMNEKLEAQNQVFLNEIDRVKNETQTMKATNDALLNILGTSNGSTIAEQVSALQSAIQNATNIVASGPSRNDAPKHHMQKIKNFV